MEILASPCELQSFKSTPSDKLSNDHIELLLKWFEEHTESQRSQLIGVVQNLVDELFTLSDGIRTDLLTALTWLYQEHAIGSREVCFADLESNLDLLEVWDLEPALEILGFQIHDTSIGNLRRFCVHECGPVRVAAHAALQRLQMTRWFRRAS